MLLADLPNWWLASFSLDLLLALTIVEWLRAVSSRTMGQEYTSAFLPAVADQLDGCFAQIATTITLLSALRVDRLLVQARA